MAFSYPIEDGRVRVELDLDEMRECREIVQVLCGAADVSGKHVDWSGAGPERINVVNVLSECATFAWYYGDDEFQELFFDATLKQARTLQADPGYDIVVGGYKCDVKGRWHEYKSILQLKPEQVARPKAHFFLLAMVNPWEAVVELVGTTTVKEARKYPPVSINKKPASHNLPEKVLRKINPEPDRESIWEWWRKHEAKERSIR